MNTVFTNRFLTIQHAPQENLLVAIWTSETEKATNDDFKQWNKHLVEQVTKLQPIGLLANTRDYTFVISPELQNWSITNVFEQFANAGLRKIAMITTGQIFAQVALEQFIDEYKAGTIETKYFETETEARNWLLEK